MSGVPAYLPTALALVVAAYEFRQCRTSASPTAARALCLFALAMGAATALLAPPTREALAQLPPAWPGVLAYLLGRELEMVALCFLVLTVFALELPGPAPSWTRHRTRRWHVRLTAAALVLCTVAFLLGRARSAQGHVSARGSGRLAVAAFDSVFTLYSLWCLCVFVLVVHRHARGLGRGVLRTGLRLVLAGGLVGLLWALWGFTSVAGMLARGRQSAGQDPVAVLLSSCCLLLGGLGATAARWQPLTARALRWLRACQEHLMLRPLWSALRAVLPDGAVLAGRGRGVEFARYRRVIEIRDGYLALRPYLHPRTARWTAEALDRHPVPGPRRPAVVEAAAIAVALECAGARGGGRAADGRTGEAIGPPPAPCTEAVRDSLDAEAAWLTRVARELTCSPAVAYARACAGRHVRGTP
ncbi:MAB_1171c family putative transporter [Streptomyces sp. NPDC006984]|uniref:MAB_1171c family putative transporter n=1 Tax=Streptomyces sp. NPDC006984 TaxID=3155463 RepID=UPI003401BF72